jgi:hypothetical protein
MIPRQPEESQPLKALPGRVYQLRQELQAFNPEVLAEHTSASYIPASTGPENPSGEFRLPFWNREIALDYPGFVARDPETGKELSLDVQAILLFHFQTSRGTPVTGRWIAFSELPDGRFYSSAFQGYTGSALAQVIQEERGAFEKACLTSGGKPFEMGDEAYTFHPLPRIPLLAVYWQGDEDFPASIQILFEASIVHHLPTDVCAILGSMLTRRIIKAHTAE